MNYKKLCYQAIKIVKKTAKFIDAEKEKITVADIEDKSLNNFVTYVDKNAEKMLVAGLSKLLPESGFIAEEGTSTKKGDEFNWVIDPLDGTTNFLHRCPPFAISVALMKKDEVVLGIVYEINLKECFYAWQGSDAYLNNRKITVTTCSELRNTFIATGFPYHAFDRMKPFMQTLEYFFEHSPGVRRLGSAATDLAYVACGRFDAFYEYNLNPWDVAAGAFIIQQAGGKITDFTGGNNYIFGKEIVATNGTAHANFLEVIQRFMAK